MNLRKSYSAATNDDDKSWMTSLGLAPAPNAFAMEANMAKVRRMVALWPATIYAQAIAVLLVFTAMAVIRDFNALAFASLSAGAMIITSISLFLFFRSKAFWKLAPYNQAKIALPFVAIIGVALAVLGWQASLLPASNLAVVSVAAVLAACVVILVALLSMHGAMIVFAATSILTAISLAQSSVVAIIGIALLACLWAMTLTQARFDHYLNRRHQIEVNKSRRANRLIAEFETNGNGWFWETDREGDLVYLSHKLADALNCAPEDLLGQPFTGIIQSAGGSDDGQRTLGYHLTSRSAFAEVTVRASVDASEGEERWWSVSGRPIIDKIGQFRGFSGNGTDLTEKRRSENQANRLARYDELTGLANRQQTRLTLEKTLASGHDGKAHPVALLLLDLDRFKTVNDTMGHLVGDSLLKQVSQRLFRVVGEHGMVGRLGGDEFQIVLPGTYENEALSGLAKTVIATLSEPYMIDGVTLTIGCSIGVAIGPKDGETAEELVRNADLALYAAKGDGRGVHRFYEKEMHAGAKKRKRLEDDLRKALNNDELHLTYQPVVGTTDTRIVGYEALIRWNHPSRGAISPADFIPVAEDIRLIEQIGEWVMRSACKDAVQWPGDVRVAVNVSPIQFANPSLPGIVTSALAESGLPPERLELEITEGVFLNENANTDQMFKALKAIGVRLALDDFGTGYSSLGYLKKAPFDKIKIDQSFIRGAAVTGNRNAAIIKAIVSLAKTLYMETTAEGVELEDEITLVRDLGCSHIQGYIYGKPMRADEAHRQLVDGGGKAVAEGYKASRSPRTSMLRSTQVEVNGEPSKVRIRNLSATGAMLEGIGKADVNSDVLIEILENQMFPARIRWAEEDRVGIEFARSFDLERLHPDDPGYEAMHRDRAVNG